MHDGLQSQVTQQLEGLVHGRAEEDHGLAKGHVSRGQEALEVEVGGQNLLRALGRVGERGAGGPLGFLAGLGGLTKWPPLRDLWARGRGVIVPSWPGYPGGPPQDKLDCQLDWAIAVHELLAGAGLEGADLIGVSTGGALAAEVAAIDRKSVV